MSHWSYFVYKLINKTQKKKKKPWLYLCIPDSLNALDCSIIYNTVTTKYTFIFVTVMLLKWRLGRYLIDLKIIAFFEFVITFTESAHVLFTIRFSTKKPPVKKPTFVELTSLKFPGKTSNLHIIVLMNVLLRAVGQFYRNAQCFQQNLRYAWINKKFYPMSILSAHWLLTCFPFMRICVVHASYFDFNSAGIHVVREFVRSFWKKVNTIRSGKWIQFERINLLLASYNNIVICTVIFDRRRVEIGVHVSNVDCRVDKKQ